MALCTCTAESGRKRLDECIVRWLSRAREVQGDALDIGPQVEVAADELGTLIDPDRLRIAHRTPRAVRQRFQSIILVAVEDLVAGLARNTELTAHIAHTFSVHKTDHKPKTFLHHRTLHPRYQHLPQKRKTVTHVWSAPRIAQLVEHDLAKVGVASSSLVFRSIFHKNAVQQ
jgi:hypothetical protein